MGKRERKTEKVKAHGVLLLNVDFANSMTLNQPYSYVYSLHLAQ